MSKSPGAGTARQRTARQRAEELVRLMTFKEKTAQLRCEFVQDIIDGHGNYTGKDRIGPEGIGGLAFERVRMNYSVQQEVQIINEVTDEIRKNSRMGIPPLIHAETLHGLCLKGAVSFPQSIGMAATWDVEMMEEASAVIARECRARGIRQALSPCVDIARDLRWGRVEETYGEDPCLVSRMAVAYCRSFEKEGVITTPKAFVANSGEGGRDSAPVYYSERLLKSVFFKPYRECIAKAGSRSVMVSYNTLDSVPCGLNQWLIKDMLRGYMGFDGFVVTDYGMMEKARNLLKISDDLTVIAAKAVKAGVNRELPDQGGYTKLEEALGRGLITEEEIDALVLDILKAKFEIGLFDEDLFCDPDCAAAISDCEKHRETAYRAAQKSLVLLRNDGVLPLKSQKIALTGTLAVHPRLGGYSTWDIEVPSLADLLTEADYIDTGVCSNDAFYIVENPYVFSLDDQGRCPGWKGIYKDNKEFSFGPKLIRYDDKILFDWSSQPVDEHPDFEVGKGFSVEWRGFLSPAESGNYTFCIEANGGVRLEIDAQMLIDRFQDTVTDRQTACCYLEKGKTYPVVVGFSTSGSNPKISFSWDYVAGKAPSEPDYARMFSGYDTCIYAVGVTEGEGSDRANLDLPQTAQRLITDLADAGKKVVVIIYAGSAVTMSGWIDRVSAVLYAWYPGQEGSRALADVLRGNYNPAGRLPISFPEQIAQVPIHYDSEPRGRNSGYHDLSDQPLFEFGYGLSYTAFSYGALTLSSRNISAGETCTARITVTNTGVCDGEEVVQLYIHDLYSSVTVPERKLQDFQRIFLKRGEAKELVFVITPEMLSLLDEQLHEVVEAGDFEILIGSSSRDIRQRAVLTVSESDRPMG